MRISKLEALAAAVVVQLAFWSSAKCEDAPRTPASTFSAQFLYWAPAKPILCQEWYVVLSGTVLETHEEDFGELRGHGTAGTMNIERIFLNVPSDHESLPAGAKVFASDLFDELKPGDKVLVFVSEYDGGYGILEAHGSNIRQGIRLDSWDHPVVQMLAAASGAAPSTDRKKFQDAIVSDPRTKEVWAPFNQITDEEREESFGYCP